MAAVFAIDLCEAEHLAVCEFSAKLGFHSMQVFYFFGRESKAFLLVVFFEVFDVDDGFGLTLDGEDVLVQAMIEALKHGVVVGIFAADSPVFFDTANAVDGHILCDFHSVGAPRCYHFSARTNEVACQVLFFLDGCSAIEPNEFFYLFCSKCMIGFRSDNALLRSLEESYHHSFRLLGFFCVQSYNILSTSPIFHLQFLVDCQ